VADATRIGAGDIITVTMGGPEPPIVTRMSRATLMRSVWLAVAGALAFSVMLPTFVTAAADEAATDVASARVWLLVAPGPGASALTAGALEAAADRGLEAQTSLLPLGAGAQAEALRRIIALGPDGMAVAVDDPGPLAGAISEAQASGVPVVLISHAGVDLMDLSVPGVVRRDDELAGQEAARALVEAGVDHAVCVMVVAADPVQNARCRGAIAAMTDAGGRMDPLYALDPPGDPTGVRDAIVARIVLEPGIDGILAAEEAGLAAAVQAQPRWPGDRSVILGAIAPAADPSVRVGLEDGTLRFVIDQRPFRQGALAMASLSSILDGGGPDPQSPRIVEPRIREGQGA
jgi:simple sugar transport system substrate-binding protein